MQAKNNGVSALQTQVHSLTETLCETRRDIVRCCQDMHGFETRLSDICYVVQELGELKAKVMVLHRTVQHENVTVRSNELSF